MLVPDDACLIILAPSSLLSVSASLSTASHVTFQSLSPSVDQFLPTCWLSFATHEPGVEFPTNSTIETGRKRWYFRRAPTFTSSSSIDASHSTRAHSFVTVTHYAFLTCAVAQCRRRVKQLAAITEIVGAVKDAHALSSPQSRPSNLQPTRTTIQPPPSNASQNGVLTSQYFSFVVTKRPSSRRAPFFRTHVPLLRLMSRTSATQLHNKRNMCPAALRSTCIRGARCSTRAPTHNDDRHAHRSRMSTTCIPASHRTPLCATHKPTQRPRPALTPSNGKPVATRKHVRTRKTFHPRRQLRDPFTSLYSCDVPRTPHMHLASVSLTHATRFKRQITVTGWPSVPAGLDEFGECVPILGNSKIRQPLQFREQLHGFLSVVQSQTTREFQVVPMYMVYPPGPCPQILCGAHKKLEVRDGERELVKEHNFELYRIVRIATAGTLEHGIYATLTYLMLPSAYPSHTVILYDA